MYSHFLTAEPAITLRPLTPAEFEQLCPSLSPLAQSLAEAQGFSAQPDQQLHLIDQAGAAQTVLYGLGASPAALALGNAPYLLPAKDYRLEADPSRRRELALAFGLGAYRYTRYKASPRAPARLHIGDAALVRDLEIELNAVAKVRDLTNTPAEDLGPEQLLGEVWALAGELGLSARSYSGAELRSRFPLVHAVGRAANREPLVGSLEFGPVGAPRVAIVGKGVCFDSGGLDLKPADGMRQMKKDMGGAAHAIALATWIARTQLPLRVHLVIGAVENAVAGNAMRPGDIYRSRKGLTVEIGNTDAEGRLVLADCLAYADEQRPDLIVDFATLTGAARIALGPDLPALFANRDDWRDRIWQAGAAVHDPVWPLPLYAPYAKWLDSNVADLNNDAAGAKFAGAISGALFMERFVSAHTPYVHLDTYAWNDKDRPGRPAGGEALGLRAVYSALVGYFGAGV